MPRDDGGAHAGGGSAAPAAHRWRAGHRLLATRARAVPELLRTVLAAAPALPFDPARVRRVVATGVGSSAAHARLLAVLLEEAGLHARFVPASGFVAVPEEAARGDALVVFSQGLSPNARLALAHVERWAAVLLVTALPPDVAPPPADGGAPPPAGALAERRRLLDALVARGVAVQPIPAAEEYGTLLRVAGPATGHAAAIVLARAIASAAGRAATGLLPAALPVDEVCACVAGAARRLAREHGDLDAAALEEGLAFLAAGVYGEVLGNLRAKVVEGMLLREPPVWDLLEFAHGPFQQAYDRRGAFLCLTRNLAAEDELVARLERMLVEGRHRLVRWRSSLPGALALLEHEALVDALVLRYVEERALDPCDWPGRGADAPLYGLERFAARGDAGSPAPLRDATAGGAPGTPALRLDRLAWPDVAALIASGCRTALLPLGSTEQHGPHLPLATDTLVADAVAGRVCARLPGTIRLPTLMLGCAREHLAFAGTLSLGEETLTAILRDLATALARHGLARLLVFSAHGGNDAVLRAAAAAIAPDVAPLVLDAFHDRAALDAALGAVAARSGITADEAGQHAGEIETSIVLGLAPALVRRERLARGLTGSTLPPDELFYPDLRRHAPDGTVGDPRGAHAARADAYLDAWADVLAAAWSADAKKRK